MSKIKNNIDSLTTDTESIAKDYLNLLVISITEKLSLLIGILFSIFLISTLLLIVVLIGSIALAGFLNKILDSYVWGHLIVAGSYLLFIGLLVLKMVRSETPLLSNLFVKLMIFILDIEDPKNSSVKGLKVEKKRIKERLDLNKNRLKSDFQLLRYSILDTLVKELLGLFTRKKKTSERAAKATSKPDPAPPKPKKRARKKE